MKESQTLHSLQMENRSLRKKNRSIASEEHRTEILSTPLPAPLAVRKKYKARVAVRTVRTQTISLLFNLVVLKSN